MNTLTVNVAAPGKALILGEYAVLEGYPAVVQALNKYARVEIRPDKQFTVSALPLLDQPLAFQFDHQQRFEWQNASSQQHLPFVAPLMRALGDWHSNQKQCWSLTLDTQQFFTPSGDKIGLGSSAALTVALAAAWYQQQHAGQVFDKNRWLPLLVELHRSLQDGRGSGADIAASLFGGLIEYRTDFADQPITAKPIQWPANVECIWIWLGHSASTRVFLHRMQAFKTETPKQYATHLQRLGELSQAGCDAFANGSTSDSLDIIKAYGQAMQALGEAADAPVYTDAHRRLAQLAEQHNVAFKPSGAGGGDIALAASANTQALTNFALQVQAAGYGLLELTPAEQGIVIEPLTGS